MDKEFLMQLIYRYETATFTVNRRMNALFKEQMMEDLTVDQYSMLRYIREKGVCTSSELADTFCVGKSSITAIIQRLFEKRLISRKPDEKDRRVTYLSLTDEGERLSELMVDKIQDLLSEIILHFNAQEAKGFIETYEKLAAVLTKSAERGDQSE